MIEIKAVLDTVVDLMKIEFEIYGWRISLWNIGIFNFVSAIFGWVVWEVLNRD